MQTHDILFLASWLDDRASNVQVQKFMSDRGWTGDFSKLEQYFMQRLINVTAEATKDEMKYIVWQEVIDNNVTLPSDTVIHVWKDGFKFQNEMARVTEYGYRTLLSSPWYLNYINYGVDWDRYYVVEPLSFDGTEAQKRLVRDIGPMRERIRVRLTMPFVR